MAQFKVVWEIQLEANSPLEAAKTAREWQLDKDSSATMYYVQEDEKKEVFSVDLLEDDEDAVLPIDYVSMID